ncbi:hypothetical protein AGR1B_Cc10223 [Agrobacterium fabacearum S56]|nr:hypothetical protein AGR1B_Cc10223 [Agrobacterium fabacearum S56]
MTAAPVAQLDRVLDSDSKGHRFESCRVRHFTHLTRKCTEVTILRAAHVRQQAETPGHISREKNGKRLIVSQPRFVGFLTIFMLATGNVSRHNIDEGCCPRPHRSVTTSKRACHPPRAKDRGFRTAAHR